MTKITGSGSISQRHGSADPDPPQNVMDPNQCCGSSLVSRRVLISVVNTDPHSFWSVGSGSQAE